MLTSILNSYRNKKGLILPRNSDYWLVSYPRSGNTWLRLILASYIWDCPEIKNLQDLQVFIPDLYYERAGISPRTFSGKYRIIKSHEQYRADYHYVIYMYRRPFDCAWSYFHFNKEREGSGTDFDEFITSFLNGRLPYGSWHDHLVRWRDLHRGRHIFISYENLLETPKQYLGEITSFLGLEYDDQRAEKALDSSSPNIVARITNDKTFYGKEFKGFVKSPLGIGLEVKEKLRSEYAARFQEWNEIYEEQKDGRD